jgi:small basic protein (TIGR04137 family)
MPFGGGDRRGCCAGPKCVNVKCDGLSSSGFASDSSGDYTLTPWFRVPGGTGDFVSIDSSLRGKGRLARSRNVLKREERIAFLKAEDRWMGTESAFGLPKIRVIKSALGKKKKKKTEEEGDAAAPAAKGGAKAAPAAKGAPAAKAAAPAAKGAKK